MGLLGKHRAAAGIEFNDTRPLSPHLLHCAPIVQRTPPSRCRLHASIKELTAENEALREKARAAAEEAAALRARYIAAREQLRDLADECGERLLFRLPLQPVAVILQMLTAAERVAFACTSRAICTRLQTVAYACAGGSGAGTAGICRRTSGGSDRMTASSGDGGGPDAGAAAARARHLQHRSVRGPPPPLLSSALHPMPADTAMLAAAGYQHQYAASAAAYGQHYGAAAAATSGGVRSTSTLGAGAAGAAGPLDSGRTEPRSTDSLAATASSDAPLRQRRISFVGGGVSGPSTASDAGAQAAAGSRRHSVSAGSETGDATGGAAAFPERGGSMSSASSAGGESRGKSTSVVLEPDAAEGPSSAAAGDSAPAAGAAAGSAGGSSLDALHRARSNSSASAAARAVLPPRRGSVGSVVAQEAASVAGSPTSASAGAVSGATGVETPRQPGLGRQASFSSGGRSGGGLFSLFRSKSRLPASGTSPAATELTPSTATGSGDDSTLVSEAFSVTDRAAGASTSGVSQTPQRGPIASVATGAGGAAKPGSPRGLLAHTPGGPHPAGSSAASVASGGTSSGRRSPHHYPHSHLKTTGSAATAAAAGAPAGKGVTGMLDYQQAGALLAKVKAAEAAVASSRLQMQDLCEKLRTVETVRDFLKQRLEDAEAEAAAAHASRDAAHAQSLINAETLTFLDEKMQDTQRAADATAAALEGAQRRAAEAEARVAAERASAEELRSQMEAARAHAAALQAQVQALQAQRSADGDGGSGGSRDRSVSSSGGSGHGDSPLDAAALAAASSLSVAAAGGGGGAAAGPSPPGPPPFSPAERAALLRQLRVLEGAVKASRDRIRELTGGGGSSTAADAGSSSGSGIAWPATPTDNTGSVVAGDADAASGKLRSVSTTSADGSGRRGSVSGRGSLCATSAAAILAAAAAGGGLLAPSAGAGDGTACAQPPLPPPTSPLPPLPPKAHNGFAASASAAPFAAEATSAAGSNGDGAAASWAPEVATLSRAELLELVRRMEAAQEAEAANWRAQKRTLVAAVRKLRGEEAGASPAATGAVPATASS